MQSSRIGTRLRYLRLQFSPIDQEYFGSLSAISPHENSKHFTSLPYCLLSNLLPPRGEYRLGPACRCSAIASYHPHRCNPIAPSSAINNKGLG